MSRKAMELSLNTVVIAAIALLVLIVIVLVFTGQLGKYTRGINDCKSKGGEPLQCRYTDAECMTNGGVPSGPCTFYDQDGKKDPSDSNSEKVCCVYRK